MLLGVAAIRPPRQGTLAITRRVGRSSAGARVNGSSTKLPIGVAPRRRPNLSKKAGDPRPPRIPFHLASHRVVCDVMANGTGLPRPCTHKSRLVRSGWLMSALPPKADIRERMQYVCFVPTADIPRDTSADDSARPSSPRGSLTSEKTTEDHRTLENGRYCKTSQLETNLRGTRHFAARASLAWDWLSQHRAARPWPA